MFAENLILTSDSYKYSHWKQYPKGTEYVYSYIESRGGLYDEGVFFGLQAWVKDYLMTQITQEMIDDAEAVITAHMGPGIFNREGWEYILNECNGYIPLEIKAAPEGLIIPVKNALVTMVNTDPNVPWVTSFFETSILRAVWYGVTVATNSWDIKKTIVEFVNMTSDNPDAAGVMFKLHDFGGRGVTSGESAGLGGMAHLINFYGTDTVEGMVAARRFFNVDITKDPVGFSLPAAEHSTMTSWGGREGEPLSMENMLDQFLGKDKALAVVSDSYDIYYATREYWGGLFKTRIEQSGGLLVIRPDSGVPHEVVLNVLNILGECFGYTVNSKGYKVLPPYIRVIQGDGVNRNSIRKILEVITEAGWAAENVVFGSGGALLQQLDRDTMKFACKCSAIRVNGKWIDVFKDPITDKGKQSKKGKLMLYRFERNGEYFTGPEKGWFDYNPTRVLETVYKDGVLYRDMTFDEVRKNAA